jgi:predicted GNAT superfamily acetyltransferase
MGSNVQVRDVVERAELEEVSALFTDVWKTDEPQVPFALLRALSHTGGMVLGAYGEGRLIGAAVGFCGSDLVRPSLHSHIVGVTGGHRGTGVGTAIKLHQRRWCLDRGIGEMTWTFDPLVRRNAVFNIARLGASGTAYHTDFYGPMDDTYNAGVPTDRVLVRWDLTHHAVTAIAEGAVPPSRDEVALRDHQCVLDVGEDGDPRPGEPPAPGIDVWVRVPLAAHDARAQLPVWRTALRDVMHPLFRAGYQWTHVTDDGWYVLTPPTA